LVEFVLCAILWCLGGFTRTAVAYVAGLIHTSHHVDPIDHNVNPI